MTEEVMEYYVLFPNHNSGLQLYNKLKSLKIKATITPTPRRASTCCGISLLVLEKDVEDIKTIVAEEKIEILKIEALPKISSASRDKFC